MNGHALDDDGEDGWPLRGWLWSCIYACTSYFVFRKFWELNDAALEKIGAARYQRRIWIQWIEKQSHCHRTTTNYPRGGPHISLEASPAALGHPKPPYSIFVFAPV
jgi:hypothetical protein